MRAGRGAGLDHVHLLVVAHALHDDFGPGCVQHILERGKTGDVDFTCVLFVQGVVRLHDSDQFRIGGVDGRPEHAPDVSVVQAHDCDFHKYGSL